MNHIALPLLMLGLSLSPVLCWAVEPNDDEARAITEIEKLGGKVTVNEKSPGKPVISVDYKYTGHRHSVGLRRRVATTPKAGPGWN